MNTTSLEELPDDLAQEAESLKLKEDEAYEKAIGVIKLLKTDTKKGIIELKNLFLNSQMDQNEEELPKAA